MAASPSITLAWAPYHAEAHAAFEAAARKAGYADAKAIARACDKGRGVVLVGFQRGAPVLYAALCRPEADRVHISGATGSVAGADLTRDVLPWIEQNVQARRLTMQTKRRGLVRKLQRQGYTARECAGGRYELEKELTA